MPNQIKDKSPYYPDIQLFLILIPFISAFNYYLTYSNIRFNGFLILTYTIDTVTGYIAWISVRRFILVLDKKIPYRRNALKRILIQIVFSTVIGLVVISVLTELASWIFRGKPADVSFYKIDIFIISIWFLVINGIYIGLHYFYALKDVENLHQEQKTKIEKGFIVRHGNQDLRLEFKEIAAFYVDDPYIVVQDVRDKKYFVNQSLEKIQKEIPRNLFYRLNRQIILQRNLIQGFKRMKNGKLQVILNEDIDFLSDLTISRHKAPSFKAWFRSFPKIQP